MPDLVSVHSQRLIAILISSPLVYMLISYAYLAWWHGRPYLLNTIVHENGRLTLLGSVFYFDHFVAHVPMIAAFGWCAVGGVALTARVPRGVHLAFGAGLAAVLLLSAATVLVVLSFLASLFTVGWQRTIDYLLQRIERDGVMSKGGLWNQLQLSNVPIALGTIGLGSALRTVNSEYPALGDPRLFAGGMVCIGAAAAVLVVMSMATWPRWRDFLNPRWLAHSMREVATYPLTGIPTALGSVVLVQYLLWAERMDPAAWLAIFGPRGTERVDCRDRVRTGPKRGHSRDCAEAVVRRGADVDYLFARFARVRARAGFRVHRAVFRRQLRGALLGRSLTSLRKLPQCEVHRLRSRRRLRRIRDGARGFRVSHPRRGGPVRFVSGQVKVLLHREPRAH